jgi:hypothetical protein
MPAQKETRRFEKGDRIDLRVLENFSEVGIEPTRIAGALTHHA